MDLKIPKPPLPPVPLDNSLGNLEDGLNSPSDIKMDNDEAATQIQKTVDTQGTSIDQMMLKIMPLKMDAITPLLQQSFGPINTSAIQDKIVTLAGTDPSAQLSAVLNKIVTGAECGAELYLYYIAIRNLRPWLDQRISIIDRIKTNLTILLSIQPPMVDTVNNVDRDMKTIIMYLEAAQQALTNITPMGKDTINQSLLSGVNIQQITKQKNYSSLALPMAKLKTAAFAKILSWIKLAQQKIDSARSYIRLATVDQLKKKTVIGTLSSPSSINAIQLMLIRANTIISALEELTSLTPVISVVTLLSDLGQAMSKMSVNKFVTDMTGLNTDGSVVNVSKLTLGQVASSLVPGPSLKSLNDKIKLARLTVKLYPTTVANFVTTTTASHIQQNSVVRNALLDTFVSHIKTDWYPKSTVEYLVDAVKWDPLLEAIDVSLYLINPADLVNFNDHVTQAQAMTQAFSNAVVKQQSTADYSADLYNELTGRFASLAKLPLLSSTESMRAVLIQIRYLLKLCTLAEQQDIELEAALQTMAQPPGYALFEKAMDTSMNVLQKYQSFGPHTTDIINAIKDGSYLNAVVGIGTKLSNVASQLNKIKSALGLPLSPHSIDLNLAPIFKDKNLLPKVPDYNSVGDAITKGLANQEVNKSLVDAAKTK